MLSVQNADEAQSIEAYPTDKCTSSLLVDLLPHGTDFCSDFNVTSVVYKGGMHTHTHTHIHTHTRHFRDITLTYIHFLKTYPNFNHNHHMPKF